jgi:6-phospho-beta-glucosidase
MPGLPFDPALIAALEMIPNEYLYYYYSSIQAVQNILAAGRSRGEQIAALNTALFDELQELNARGQTEGMLARYQAYLQERGETYMRGETGGSHSAGKIDPRILQAMHGEGYAGVALDLIEGLTGLRPRQMILNVPNRGAIQGLPEDAVVEIPAHVGAGTVRSLATGIVPAHCLGLMQSVKAYERLAIAAATEGSYEKAQLALTLHPLVRDASLAKAILDGYIQEHGELFPRLG